MRFSTWISSLAAVSTAWRGGCVVEKPSVPGQGISCSRDPPALQGRENKQGCPVPLRQPGHRGYSIKVKAAGRAMGWRKIRPPALSPRLSSYLQTCLQGFSLLPFGSPHLCTGQRQIEMAVKILIGTSRYLYIIAEFSGSKGNHVLGKMHRSSRK